jgi:8-oxo-dGTP pyrophosphatase MutT (NUDIX family)
MPKRVGRKSAAQTPAPPKERIKGSLTNIKGSASSKATAKGIELSEQTLTALKNKLQEYNKENEDKVSLNTLKAVYRRGAGAYSSSHRPTITGGVPNTRNAWAMARVNKFLKKKSGEAVKKAYVQDDDLLAKGGKVMPKSEIEVKLVEDESLSNQMYKILTNEIGNVGRPRLALLENGKVIGGIYLQEPSTYTLNGVKTIEPYYEYKFDIFIKRSKRHKGYSKLLLDAMINDFVKNFPDADQIRAEVINKKLEKSLIKHYGFMCDSGNDENITYCYLTKSDAKKYRKVRFDGGGSVLLAPNGKPSNLKHEQYKLVRTPQFKAWFGDWENDPENASKVVDENGEPLVVYHGTQGDFNVFDKKYIKKGSYGFGFYFTPSLKYAEYQGKVLSCFLNMRNPEKKQFSEYTYGKKINNKYDGQIISNELGISFDLSELVVLNSNQIKLADGTNTTFDAENNDIRYSDGGEISKKIDEELKIKGFEFNKYNYRYGKEINEKDYITAFYDKTKRLYKIRGVHKFKTPLGENSVGIQFDFSNEDEFWNKINDYLLPDKYNKGGLIAPNGKPSNLTPEQYILVRTPEFKAWFGDWENDPENASKVVDENGEPMVVYHGTDKLFNVFKINEKNPYSYFAKNYNYAFNYAKDEDKIGKPKVYQCFLNIKTPLNTTDSRFNNPSEYLAEYVSDIIIKDLKKGKIKEPHIWDMRKSFQELRNFIQAQDPTGGAYLWYIFRTDGQDYSEYKKGLADWLANKNKNKKSSWLKKYLSQFGYDGFIQYENIHGEGVDKAYSKIVKKEDWYASLVFGVFNSNQIKLADGTNTTFDPENPDIRYDDGGKVMKGYEYYTRTHSDGRVEHFSVEEYEREHYGAGILFYCQNTARILLIQRSEQVSSPHKWGISGGGKEKGEDAIGVAKRETFEEIGYEVERELRPLYLYQEDSREFQTFLCCVNEEFTPKLNWESSDYMWVNINQMPQNIHYAFSMMIIDSGLEHILNHIVACNACGWSWQDAETTPEEMFICHKCNHNNMDNTLSQFISPAISIEDIAAKHGVPIEQIKQEYDKGIEHELEHVNKNSSKEVQHEVASRIASHHIEETPNYYTKLQAIENKQGGGDIAENDILENSTSYMVLLFDTDRNYGNGHPFEDINEAMTFAQDYDDFEIRERFTGKKFMKKDDVMQVMNGVKKMEDFYKTGGEIEEYEVLEFLQSQREDAESLLVSDNTKLAKIMICKAQIDMAEDKQSQSNDYDTQTAWFEAKKIWQKCLEDVKSQQFYHKDNVMYFAKGGLAYGNSHDKGGIPIVVKSTGQNIEIEGGEGVINKRSMQMDKKLDFQGKKMTPCEIISKINEMGGGVKFKCADVKEIVKNDGDF